MSDRQAAVRVQDGEYKTVVVMYRGDGPGARMSETGGRKHARKDGPTDGRGRPNNSCTINHCVAYVIRRRNSSSLSAALYNRMVK